MQKTPRMIIDEMTHSKAYSLFDVYDWLKQIAEYVELTSPKQLKKSKARINKNTQIFIQEYATVYEARYGVSPVINGKSIGIAKRIVNDIGIDKAVKFVHAYLQIGMDPWFVSKKYPLDAFEKNLNAIAIFAETGKYMTYQEAVAKERKMLKNG